MFSRAARRARQTFANDRDGHPRLEARLHGTGGDDDVVQVRPAFRRDAFARPVEDTAAEEMAQVVAVDPLHLHHADAVAIDKVLDIEQVVLLDLRDTRGHRCHPGHRLVVGLFVFEPLGRKELDRHRSVNPSVPRR